ncbi:cytochrome oxidase putative small subunit CydP [Marinobacterium aestuariivivens]|uniref:Cytochrome oxidase putative small subunit CydP n=1 Tax=Marinobacterium aestuariivivens TaxID=1698799 RepID=A0ABW2A6B4_9GAMM
MIKDESTVIRRRWKRSGFAIEISLILIVKMAILFGIKAVWFDAPTIPVDGTRLTEERLLSVPGNVAPPPQPKEIGR